jgi:hypothetical protein
MTIQTHCQIPVSGGAAPSMVRGVFRHFARQFEAFRQAFLGRI